MKCQQAEERHTRVSPRKRCEQRRHENRSRPAVKQQVVILLVVMERRLLPANRRAYDVIHNPQTIRIRQNACQGDELSVARIVCHDRGYQPAPDEMRDGGHDLGWKFFSMRHMVAIPVHQHRVAGILKQGF